MTMIQPKPYIDKLKLRHKSFGKERRRNLSKIILDKGTPFPKPITYQDIDKSFFDWVDEKLDISYDGKKLPTYKLFSSQKISEYSETWKNLDETGNIIMNFKTVTRDNNPQHGENQGGNYNIPGHRDYTMFAVPVLQENGDDAYDLYTMKQPFAINFIYTVSLVVNKYELLNQFNEMVNYEFQSIECYISPNGHAMPMMIDSINDESEYTVDDRKFYSQTYKIKVLGYIIRKEDYNVHRVPSRFLVRFLADEDGTSNSKTKRNNVKDLPNIKVGTDGLFRKSSNDLRPIGCKVIADNVIDLKKPRPKVVYSEEPIDNPCKNESNDDYYHNKRIEYDITLLPCESSVTFTVESNMVLDEVNADNVYDFSIYINNEFTKLDDIVNFYEGDSVKVLLTRNDLENQSSLKLIGYDPDVVIDGRLNPESELDAVPDGEKILVYGNDDDNNRVGKTTADD